MTTLYEMTKTAKDIIDYLDSLGVDEEIKLDTIEAETEINEKLISYGHVIRSFDSNNVALEAEIARLSKIRLIKKNQRENIAHRALDAMLQTNIKEVKSPLFTLKVRTNPESVHILNESSLPSEYFRIKQEPNKTAIKVALQEGKSISGAELVRTKSLQFK